MWSNINRIFTTHNSQNCWAHLSTTNNWHRVYPGAPDGVTNVYLILAAAKANNKPAFVVKDSAGKITAAYI